MAVFEGNATALQTLESDLLPHPSDYLSTLYLYQALMKSTVPTELR